MRARTFDAPPQPTTATFEEALLAGVPPTLLSDPSWGGVVAQIRGAAAGTATASSIYSAIQRDSSAGAYVLTDQAISRERNKRMTDAGARVVGTTSSGISINAQYKRIFCNIRLNRDVLKKFAEYDILIPFGFMLSRPFMRYDMCSGILCEAGSDLGQVSVLLRFLFFITTFLTHAHLIFSTDLHGSCRLPIDG